MYKNLMMVLLGFLISTSALADDKKPEISEYQQKKLDQRGGEIRAYDVNKDGVLDTTELQKSAGSKFDAADINKDGFLSPEETAASLAKLKSQKQATFGEDDAKTQVNRVKSRMKNADENEDGNVSKQEYQSYMNNHQANFDRNGDGIISKDEYRADSEKLPSNYRKKK